MEAGTSGVLSISDSGRRVPAEYGQERHASSSVEEWISPCLSSCSRSDRPLVELSVEPAGFSGCTQLMAEMVKHLLTMQETQVRSLGLEDPLEREMAPHSSTLA